MNVRIKRAYEAASRNDGVRWLVERLWPRGVTREALAIDAWQKTVAPSTALRGWYGHVQARWPEFVHRYLDELADSPELPALLNEAHALSRLTLVYAARDETHNSARVLAAVLEQGGCKDTSAREGVHRTLGLPPRNPATSP